MARILVVEPVAQPAIDLLAAAHETDLRLDLPREQLLSLAEGYDALVVRSQTRIDDELLAAAPAQRRGRGQRRDRSDRP